MRATEANPYLDPPIINPAPLIDNSREFVESIAHADL